MKNILTLGNAADAIASSLEKYGNYALYSVKNSGSKSKNSYIIPEYTDPEEYESFENISKINFLKHIKKEVTLFVCGASKTSAMALRLLEYFYKKSINIKVVYFEPDTELCSEQQKLQERTVKNVLQEYARSGLFEEITLVSNRAVESLVESINVFEYFEQINDIFCDSYHMIEVFKNTKPIFSTFSKIKESSRIKTIGISNLQCGDKVFFPFKQGTEVIYYFGINEQKLKSEGNLLRELTENIKSKISDNMKVYFGIYPTKYESDYVYVEYHSPKIQNYLLTEN